jgi:hypothetical protein
MSNCLLPDLDYSSVHRNNRLAKARNVLGPKLANRLIAFVLFLFGANRKEIAEYLETPFDTLLSFLTRVNKYGLSGFDDRRTKSKQQPVLSNIDLTCSIKENQIGLHFGDSCKTIHIPKNNPLQLKAILLTFLDNGMINRKEAAGALACSRGNADMLLNKMRTGDISALIDKRKGQQKDYVFTPEIKSELIVQFYANAALGKPTSGLTLANDLKERTQIDLSQRSIRMHLSKLGIKGAAGKLQSMIDKKKLLGDS